MIEILDSFGTVVATCQVTPVKMSSRNEQSRLNAEIALRLSVEESWILTPPPGIDPRGPWCLRMNGSHT